MWKKELVKEALKRDLYTYEKRPTKLTYVCGDLDLKEHVQKEAFKRECINEALKRDVYIHEKRPTKETYIDEMTCQILRGMRCSGSLSALSRSRSSCLYCVCVCEGVCMFVCVCVRICV